MKEKWIDRKRETLLAAASRRGPQRGPGPHAGVPGYAQKLLVIRLAAPAVLILRTIVHQQQELGRRQALDQAIEQRLGFRISLTGNLLRALTCTSPSASLRVV